MIAKKERSWVAVPFWCFDRWGSHCFWTCKLRYLSFRWILFDIIVLLFNEYYALKEEKKNGSVEMFVHILVNISMRCHSRSCQRKRAPARYWTLPIWIVFSFSVWSQSSGAACYPVHCAGVRTPYPASVQKSQYLFSSSSRIYNAASRWTAVSSFVRSLGRSYCSFPLP